MPRPIPEETRIVVENPFVVGNVRLNKDGEKLDSWNLVDKLVAFVKSIFNFSRQPLEGVEFTIYAKEDIVHPDGVTGVVFHKGDVVATGVRGIESPAIGKTNNLGVVEFNGMYLGQYEIVETATVEGYNLDIEPRTITLAYVDGFTSPVNAEEGEINWTNERQTVRIEITKRDIEDTEKTIQGAVFGLYNKEDILNYKGEVIVEADTLLELSETDANGVAVFESDLPLGMYYVKETHNPDGYTSSNEVIEIDATYNPDVEVIEIKEDFFNEITRVNIEKYASDTNEPLVGATLAVYHGNDLIDTWVTDGTPHEIKGLITGETYTLKEIKPADGYTTAMDVTFVVEDRDLETGIYNTQVVTMTDDPTKVQIEKYASDTDKQLAGAKLAVYHGNELIESWTTDGTPHVITGLIVGETYTLKELEAPDGYNVASDVTFTVSDRNMETGEYATQVVTMTDEKKPSESHGGSGGSSEPTDDKHIVPTGVDNNMVLLGVAAVILVVIAIAFIVFATRKKDNNEDNEE